MGMSDIVELEESKLIAKNCPNKFVLAAACHWRFGVGISGLQVDTLKVLVRTSEAHPCSDSPGRLTICKASGLAAVNLQLHFRMNRHWPPEDRRLLMVCTSHAVRQAWQTILK